MADTKEKNDQKKAEIQKFAVIRTGGKQYVVKENDVIEVELLDLNEKDKAIFEVLLVAEGDKVEIGTPLLDSKRVSASVVEEVKGDKLTIFKFKKRKNYRVKTGHRQKYTQVKIEQIS